MGDKPMRLLVSLLLSVAVFSGCTGLDEIRTQHGSVWRDMNHDEPNCDYSARTAKDRAYSIEEYRDHWAAYVEFDDEGWLYRDPTQVNQIDAFEARLKHDLEDPQNVDVDFLVVAFVHGWHHNAHDSDCNVHEFRTMLRVAAAGYERAYPNVLRHRRRIIGVYVGWRGESLNIGGLRYTTVIDRRNAAERVAKGDVRQLFATLRKIQIKAAKESGDHEDRMRTVVIGHSFGGLIAFHGLSPAILNELTLIRPEVPDCRPVVQRAASDGGVESAAKAQRYAPPVFPDLLVLVNPAFEATRFEAIHALGTTPIGCLSPSFPDLRPKVIVVTSDSDIWTGSIFTIGRTVLTLLEAYPKSDSMGRSRERDANLHAIGFTNRYITHRLYIVGGVAKASIEQVDDGDGLVEPCSPVWVVRAPKDIINGHDGFLYPEDPSKVAIEKQTPFLLNWLVTLHIFWNQDKGRFMREPMKCRAAPE